MEEQVRALELAVGQLDKRLAEVAQNLLQLRGEVGQLRSEVFAELRELRSEVRSAFRWTMATMITLFGIAVPVWMGVLAYIVKRL